MDPAPGRLSYPGRGTSFSLRPTFSYAPSRHPCQLSRPVLPVLHPLPREQAVCFPIRLCDGFFLDRVTSGGSRRHRDGPPLNSDFLLGVRIVVLFSILFALFFPSPSVFFFYPYLLAIRRCNPGPVPTLRPGKASDPPLFPSTTFLLT